MTINAVCVLASVSNSNIIEKWLNLGQGKKMYGMSLGHLWWQKMKSLDTHRTVSVTRMFRDGEGKAMPAATGQHGTGRASKQDTFII